MSGIRAFVALDLPACVREPLAAACEAIRTHDHSWRGDKWVAPQNMHVTLKFLGSIAEEDVATLRAALDVSLAEHGPALLAEAGIRAVPNDHRARMLWGCFLDDGGACAALAEAAERAALRIGVAPEERSFTPHVTLVRARRPHAISGGALEAAQACLEQVPAAMSVGEVTLYRSVLTAHSPVYEPLDTWRLRTR